MKRLILIVIILCVVALIAYQNRVYLKLTLPSKEGSNTNNIEAQKTLALDHAKEIFEVCGKGRGGGEFCYGDKFKQLVKDNDLDLALQTLSALEDLDPNARGCHLIAHSITIAETDKNPDNWKDILANVDSNSCSGGFVHGVIEAHSRIDTNFVLNEKTIPELCLYVGEYHGKGGEFNCAHIMGHLLMYDTNADIPKSVETCGKIPDDMQYECFSGVFMENETRDNLVAHGVAARIPWNKQTTTDQEKICLQYSGAAGKACWREISHMYAFISFDNPAPVYKSCSVAPTTEDIDDCYLHGVGILTGSSRFDLGNMKIVCSPYNGNETKFKYCADLVVNSLMASSPKFSDRAIRFCNDIDEKHREGCFQRLGDNLARLVSPDERISLCSTAPENYKKLCTGS